MQKKKASCKSFFGTKNKNAGIFGYQHFFYALNIKGNNLRYLTTFKNEIKLKYCIFVGG